MSENILILLYLFAFSTLCVWTGFQPLYICPLCGYTDSLTCVWETCRLLPVPVPKVELRNFSSVRIPLVDLLFFLGGAAPEWKADVIFSGNRTHATSAAVKQTGHYLSRVLLFNGWKYYYWVKISVNSTYLCELYLFYFIYTRHSPSDIGKRLINASIWNTTLVIEELVAVLWMYLRNSK